VRPFDSFFLACTLGVDCSGNDGGFSHPPSGRSSALGADVGGVRLARRVTSCPLSVPRAGGVVEPLAAGGSRGIQPGCPRAPPPPAVAALGAASRYMILF
jgi:hypothetical protein